MSWGDKILGDSDGRDKRVGRWLLGLVECRLNRWSEGRGEKGRRIVTGLKRKVDL